MAIQKKKRSKVPHLALHDLIKAISYWGSMVRVSIVAFIALAVFAIRVLEVQAAPENMSLISALVTEGQMLVYVIGSFLILDVGYVIVARTYGFSLLKDRLVLIGSEFALGVCYFLPYFAVVSNVFTNVTRFVFVAVLLILSIRIVLGILYGKAVQK